MTRSFAILIIFFMTSAVYGQAVDQTALQSGPQFASSQVDLGDLVDTINLAIKIGGGVFLLVGGLGLFLMGRSYSEIRKELREDVAKIREFVESTKQGEKNLRSEVEEELRIGFNRLLDEAVEEQVGSKYPDLKKIVSDAVKSVEELEEKISTLPQFDPTALLVGVDYIAIQYEIELIRRERSIDIYEAAQSANPSAAPIILDRSLEVEYSRYNVRNSAKRKRARELFVRALSVAETLLSESNPLRSDIESLDANTFYNLAAESGNWHMPDLNQRFAQIAFSLSPAPLYEMKAIETSLASGERQDMKTTSIGLGAKRKSVVPTVRMIELLSIDFSTSRYITISVAWNMCQHTYDFDVLLKHLESLMVDEKEDPTTWRDISYANYQCARLYANSLSRNWRERFDFHVAQTGRKLSCESKASSWYEHSTRDLQNLVARVG